MKLKVHRSIGWNLEFAQMNITHYITNGCDCYPWTETFVIWPRRTMHGAPLFWTKAYKRKVWVVWGTGFHIEPEVQYATFTELLKHGSPTEPPLA